MRKYWLVFLFAGWALASLGLVAYGAWRIYRPAGYVAAGLLLWIDLLLYGRETRERDR